MNNDKPGLSQSPQALFWRHLRRNRTAMAGSIILIIFYSLALFAEFAEVAQILAYLGRGYLKPNSQLPGAHHLFVLFTQDGQSPEIHREAKDDHLWNLLRHALLHRPLARFKADCYNFNNRPRWCQPSELTGSLAQGVSWFCQYVTLIVL